MHRCSSTRPWRATYGVAGDGPPEFTKPSCLDLTSTLLRSQHARSLKQKQKTRLKILHKLYELTNGDVDKFIQGHDLASNCGIADDAQFKTAVDYLEGAYLLEAKRLNDGTPVLVQIKHAGVVEVEGAFLRPDEPTSHFLPVNVLYVNQMVGSSVQQGTVNSTQETTVQVSDGATEELKRFVEVATTMLTSVDRSLPLWQEVKSDIETLRAQSLSPKPKRSVIRDCLASLGRLCEGAAAGAIGTQLATYIPALLKVFE